ncbi:MAG: MBOAT family protein [Vicinamibacteria bacterium]|nr:MBOAT family protein [Vicinamibacteria bacterium]
MSFASPVFFAFVALVLLGLAVLRRHGARTLALGLASCLFYAAWDWRYLGLLLLVSGIDYACAAAIHASAEPARRRHFLLLSVVSNLAILGWFKYYGFFASNLALAGVSLPALEILLPAGISFYTFKSMSYTIDVYRRDIEPARNWRDYATFVSFFPELIAGPIVRASVFLPQMARTLGPTRSRLAIGGSLFLLGLTKKVVVADRLAVVADAVFASPAAWDPVTVWLGLLAYTLQIYCDFSGYSDMAIGTAHAIGFDLPENFDMPYLAASVAEFWRRWHITLSTWLRDYLYIPLGGNRSGAARTEINLMATMLLGGLWHGASWNFVLWGALHGGALVVHRAWSRLGRPLPRPIATALTFAFVAACWVPFRATSFADTRTIFERLAGFGDGVAWLPVSVPACAALALLGHALGVAARAAAAGAPRARRLFAAFDARVERDPIRGVSVRLGGRTAGGAALVSFWLLFVYYFAETDSSPFIYFQF